MPTLSLHLITLWPFYTDVCHNYKQNVGWALPIIFPPVWCIGNRLPSSLRDTHIHTYINYITRKLRHFPTGFVRRKSRVCVDISTPRFFIIFDFDKCSKCTCISQNINEIFYSSETYASCATELRLIRIIIDDWLSVSNLNLSILK